jgi:hypothetical protein
MFAMSSRTPPPPLLFFLTTCQRSRITICDLAFSARFSSIQCNIVGELISQGLLFEAETMLDATLDSVMRFRLGPNIDNVMQTVQQHKVGKGNAQAAACDAVARLHAHARGMRLLRRLGYGLDPYRAFCALCVVFWNDACILGVGTDIACVCADVGGGW